MAWWIYLPFLQEQCTCRSLCLMFRNTLCWFAFEVTCLAGWPWIWAWKISAFVWAKKNIMDFMSFKEEVNIHQQENSCFYGQYGHSGLVQIRSELLKWISWHPPIAFFSSHCVVALVHMNWILDEIKTGRWGLAANEHLRNGTRWRQVQYKKAMDIQSLPLFHSTDLLLFVLRAC